jgi:hemolysin-activating ACP:hemolysin acyltransferase
LNKTQSPEIKAEQIKQTAIDPVAGKSVAEVFGEIVWLMTQDKGARELSIKDLEHLVMPAILLRQFHIQYAAAPSGGTMKGEAVHTNANNRTTNYVPVSVEVFAMCSEAVASALNANHKIKLTFQDWQSGTQKHVVFQTKLPNSTS